MTTLTHFRSQPFTAKQPDADVRSNVRFWKMHKQTPAHARCNIRWTSFEKKKQVWHSLWHRQWSAPGRAFRARLAARQSPTANRVGGFRPKLQSRTKCPEEEKKWLSVKKTPSKNKYCLICSMVNALRKAAICSPRYRKIQNQNLLSETAILS